MSVVTVLRIRPEQFELGRVLALSTGTRLELERTVSLADATALLVWVFGTEPTAVEESVREHPAVRSFVAIDRFDGRVLYALDWEATDDHLFAAVGREGGHVLNATATAEWWTIELRFPTHEALSAFQQHCEDADVRFEVRRITTPDEPTGDQWYGLTERQRETLMLAVTTGYYDIPRQRTTVDLAEELDVSDQAVTERLRRAIVALATNTLFETGRRK